MSIKTWKQRVPANGPLGPEIEAMQAEITDLHAALADRDAKLAVIEGQLYCATLHDDGYWTWNGTPPHKSSFAGWRMNVYAAAGAAPVPTGWQPIATAPKDGTLILVRETRCAGLAVVFSGGWKYESGGICYLEPTHWMPLPAAPKDAP